MQPIDFAEKWAQAAMLLHVVGMGTEDAQAQRLAKRVVAHYGHQRTMLLRDIIAVACIEAMNEWQHYKQGAADSDRDFGPNTLSGTPYKDIDL